MFILGQNNTVLGAGINQKYKMVLDAAAAAAAAAAALTEQYALLAVQCWEDVTS
jgi:hypothetical protein